MVTDSDLMVIGWGLYGIELGSIWMEWGYKQQ